LKKCGLNIIERRLKKAMVFRIDTTCPRCGKPNSVFGHDFFCKDCSVRAFMKRTLRGKEKEKLLQKEVNKMKPEIRRKLHEEILKEVLDELNNLGK